MRHLALGDPGVTVFLELERERLVAALDDPAVDHHMHEVGHDVVEQALVMRDDHERALRIVANGVQRLHTADNAVILVTHYQRLLNYIVPDFVHVMDGGRIIKTGAKELALDLESRGYDWVSEEFRARSESGAASVNAR